MQSNDAKPLTQGLTENADENIQPTESKPNHERNGVAAELRPVVKDFIKRVVVPILVERYLTRLSVKKPETKLPRVSSDIPARRELYTVQQLAERWSCSRGTVYNILRSTGTKVVDFAAKGRKGHKLVPVAAVEEIERRKLRRLS